MAEPVLSCVTWKWRPNRPDGPTFGPEYVNRLRAALARHCHLEHRLYCVTDDPDGIDPRVTIVPLPEPLSKTPRCRRRMRIFDREFGSQFEGGRILSIDLDVVIVDDLTPILARPEPIVAWRVGHAKVYSGSFLLMRAGVLDDLWQIFKRDPDGFPRRIQPSGVASDQAMLNWYVNRRGIPVARWTEADGFVTYYGAGYEALEHLGVGPTRPELPAGARIVVLGSADKAVMDDAAYPWIRDHWIDADDAVAEAR